MISDELDKLLILTPNRAPAGAATRRWLASFAAALSFRRTSGQTHDGQRNRGEMNPDERDPGGDEEYVALPAPRGTTSQGGTGEMVIFRGRRSSTAHEEPDGGAQGSASDEP